MDGEYLECWDISNFQKIKRIHLGNIKVKSIFLDTTYCLSCNGKSYYSRVYTNISFKENLQKKKVYINNKSLSTYLSCFGKKNKLVVFAGYSGTCQIINSNTSKLYFNGNTQNYKICHAVFPSEDGKYFYFGFNNGNISVFDVALRQFKEVVKATSSILSLYLSSKKFLFIATWEKQYLYFISDLELNSFF